MSESTVRQLTHTVSVARLVSAADAAPIRSGVVVDRLLNSHGRYVNETLDWSAVPAEGPVRTVAEHVAAAAAVWDPDRTPILTARHVVLGLALEDDVAWPLLRSGVIASMLERWQPGAGTAAEPHRLIWDLLGPDGGRACEDRPLLAAAFGAPPEWRSADLPGKPSAVCWSPLGDSATVLIGDGVYEVGPERPLRRLHDAEGEVLSLACAHDGPVLLTAVSGEVRLIRTGEQHILSGPALSGRLAADAGCAWIQDTHGVHSWSPPGAPATEDLAAGTGAAVLAVDGSGRNGVVGSGSGMTVAGLTKGPPNPDLPPAPGPVALARLSKQLAVVVATEPGVAVITPDGLVVARLATGAGRTTALATDVTGRRLAVAGDHGVAVWTLSRRRPVTSAVPGFHSDFSDGEDLLDADRDARAIAALIASQNLQPPLTLGLFGSWGSGKSFLLGRIGQMVARFERAGPGSGYLGNVKVVTFNAWHYAETNLWASLVDVVLRAIGTTRAPAMGTESADRAERAAADAERAALDVSRRTAQAGRALDAVRRRRSRQVFVFAGVVLALLAAAVVAVLLGGRVVGAVATVAAGLSVAAGLLATVRDSTGQVRELTDAGAAGAGAIRRLLRRPGEDEVIAAARRLAELGEEQQRAQAEAERLRARARAAGEGLLGDVLDGLTDVTEYRDQLGLVARTRERFRIIDAAVTAARSRPAPAGTLDRVVIVIDDLDRCPAEKVVTVLEAVHLLFEFPMFVVVLAVDTRWLDQSLRIRYRLLLGEPGTAAPSDYLEKIIQLPIQLLPLDDAMVRKLISGVAGGTPGATPAAGTVDVPPATDEPVAPVDRDGPLSAERPRATRPVLAEPLTISEAEAAALAEVAPLIGRTPRTVKRFVNTYRLIKARVADPDRFDHVDDRGLGDHEAVAFLLAVLVGRPADAGELFAALARAARGETLLAVLDGRCSGDVEEWVKQHPRFADAPARYFGRWADEVGRFSFTAPQETVAGTLRATTANA